MDSELRACESFFYSPLLEPPGEWFAGLLLAILFLIVRRGFDSLVALLVAVWVYSFYWRAYWTLFSFSPFCSAEGTFSFSRARLALEDPAVAATVIFGAYGVITLAVRAFKRRRAVRTSDDPNFQIKQPS